MPNPSVVRRAVPEDHDDLWRLLLMSHRENGLFQMDAKKVEFFIQRALFPQFIHPMDTGSRAEIGVIGSTAKLEGMALLTLGNFWYSSEFHLEELIVYVDPECRRSGHAKALVEWMKSMSDDLGIPLVTGIMSRDRTEAKIRLYDRYLPRVGAIYLHPLRGHDVKRRNHNMEKGAWLASR